MYDRHPHIGGLASSFTDSAGFTWDIGGHVMFCHYKYYDECFDKLMGNDYQLNMRECWVRMFDNWVPYPFQNNIRYLPKQVHVRVPRRPVEAQTQARPQGGEELRGVHRRRVRRRHRQALHDARTTSKSGRTPPR